MCRKHKCNYQSKTGQDGLEPGHGVFFQQEQVNAAVKQNNMIFFMVNIRANQLF